MASVPPATDWAWPRLLDSLQRDITRLHETVELMRRETVEARERHREELDGLISQLRQVRAELDPILTEREKLADARDDVKWKWIDRAAWAAAVGIALAVWHYVKNHVVGE